MPNQASSSRRVLRGLRKDEEHAIIDEFTRHFKTDLHVVKAENRFLSALDNGMANL